MTDTERYTSFLDELEALGELSATICLEPVLIDSAFHRFLLENRQRFDQRWTSMRIGGRLGLRYDSMFGSVVLVVQ